MPENIRSALLPQQKTHSAIKAQAWIVTIKDILIKHLPRERAPSSHHLCQLCQPIYKLIGKVRTKVLKKI